MANDAVIGVTIKGIGDFSDVVSNVGSVQKALTKLKLPDKLGDSLNKNITNFMKEYDKYQKKIAEGIHTQGDQNAVNKSLNSMLNSYEKIIKDFGKLSSKDFKEIFNLDDSAFASVQKRIKDIQAEIKKIKLDPKQLTGPIEKISELTKAKSLFGNGKGFDKLKEAFDANDLEKAKEAIREIDIYYERFSSKMSEGKRVAFKEEFDKVKQQVTNADIATQKFAGSLDLAEKELSEIGGRGIGELDDVKKKLQETEHAAESVTEALKKQHADEFNFNREAQNIDRQIQSYFGLSQMIRKVGDIARDAFATVKDLDKAMTETAVVTNFSVGDMWDMLPTYTAQANQLGSTIRDVYEAATLYYQQGLNTNQAMGLANETLKMARIAGLDAKDATDMMTAALRGFNMEVNQMSAQKINDIYSELAAITASDTKEIGSAMERTASIANSANMEFATTSAFLAQMIETTREAPENLGTAMKTIVARFQEMKQDPTKLVDSEGVAMDANKVDKALKTIGVDLMNTKGEFRDLDDVFLDISQRWDSLTQGQQRYIATIAAGSRQQSRFIAMMSNYERTMELVDAANNSAGASQRQFEKTLDSMEAKLNKLKNAWDQFTMGLMNNQILKAGVDILTEGFTIVNKFIDALSKLGKPFGLEGLNKSLLTLVTTLSMLNLGKKGARGLVMGGAAWFKGEGSFTKNFAQGWSTGKSNVAQKQGKIDAQGYRKGWTLGLPQNSLGQTIKNALNTKQINTNIGNNLIDQLVPPGSIDAAAKEDARLYLTKLAQDLKAGSLSEADLPGAIISGLGGNIGGIDIDESALNADFMNKFKLLGGAQDGFQGLANSINNAGFSLQQFGSILEGTPLEGFGNILVKIGSILGTFGSILNTTKVNFLANIAVTEGLADEQLKEAITAGTATSAQLQHAAALGSGAIASASFAGSIKLIGKALFSALKTFLPIIAIIGALVVAYKVLDHFIVTNKEALESATDAAAAAADAYDSAKQEASELADAIDKIHEADSAFDGLVVGTAAFNEQLVAANEQIMELIKKYPMLMDANKNYVTTDANGLMHISEEGLNAVKEYQKQKQANASALNILQTNDLRAEEARQQIEALRKKNQGASEYSVDKQQNKDEIELLEKRIEAENQAAKLSAVNAALVGKEISNREKVSTILADQYDTRKSMVQLEGDKHDKRQQYAEFYGYTYNRSTKKMTDIEGNEVDFDDKVIEDALKDITILADFEVDAGAVDTAIASIDKKFSKQFSGDNSFFSDILSDNIETNEDLLRDILQNPDKLENAVSELSEKEIAAVLGVSADAVAEAPDKYKDELTDKLADKAKNIAESQADAWGELGAMIAQSEGMTAEAILDGRETSMNLIQRQLTDFTAQQRDLMVSIGKSLESGAGIESMKTFISGATDIYRSNSQGMIDEFNGLVKNVNWDSPIARLKAYNELAKSSTAEIKKMGQELLNSRDSANLLGEAFEEFYNSSDWAELSENMDNFVDASGKLNAAAVEDMAKQCSSLNNLLDTGAISAGGVAAAINALGSNGELTLLDLNSSVLKLLTDFNQLEDAISSAHHSIENFDWGIDTGEAEDFAKESAEKWKELYDNGEYGNPQLEAYAKYILGEEKYIDMLNDNHNDLEQTMNDVAKYVNRYAEGFDNAWERTAGGSWQGKKIQEKLAKAGLDDKGIKMFTEGDHIVWEPGTATTDELIKWLQEVEGVSEEWAKVMLEDWENYSPNFRAERQKNDFEAGLRDGSYIDEHRNAEGGVTITRSELETIAAATGKDIDYVKDAVEEASGNEVSVIENLGDNLDNYDKLNQDYSKAITGDINKSWIEPLTKVVDGQKQVDASQAITQAIGDGFKQDQAERMAYDELSKAVAEGTDVWYKDKLLTPEDLASFDNFKTAITEFEDNKQWVQVGEAIAQGYISYIRDAESSGQNSPNNTGGTLKDSETQPSSRMPRNMASTATEDYKQGTELTWRDKVPGWVSKLIDIYNNPPKEGTTELTPAQQQKMYGSSGGIDSTTTNDNGSAELINASASLTGAAEQLTTGTTSLTTAGESLSTAGENLATAGQNLNSAAAILAVAGQSNGSGSNQNGQSGQTTESSVSGVIVVDNSAALQALEDVKTKADEAKASIESGATFGVEVTGADKLGQASKDATSLTSKNGSSASIAVSTGTVNKDSVKKSIADINKSKATILVDANTKAAEKKARDLANKIDSYHATIDVSPNFSNTSWTHDVTINIKKNYTKTGDSDAKGRNNNRTYSTIPNLGSLAKGSRYGRLGPRGKGGLTLTGEEGYEIAWLPSESRSMILGVDGPQMINLPSDAVVYTHEQSEDILKKKQEIEAGSHSKRKRRDSPGGSGGGSKKSKKKKGKKSKSKSKSSKSSKDPTLNLFSIQEVVRFNIDQAISDLNADIEKREKEIEKGLSKIGASYKSISGATKKQISALKQIQTKNQQLLASYQAQLKEYRGQEAYVKWTTNSGESKNKKIKIKDYLNEDGSVNQAAISKLGSRAEREAVFKEVSSAKSLVDGIQKAQDEINKAGDQIEELGEKITEQFFLWENELTKIYNLTQKINNLNSLSERFASQIALETAKLGAGFGGLAQSIDTIRKVTVRNNDTIGKQIALQQQMISARQEEMENILTAVNEVKDLEAARADKISDADTKQQRIKGADENYKVAQLTYGYLKNLKQDLDGNISYDIDWAQIAKDRASGDLNTETYGKIKDRLDKLGDSVAEFNDSIKTQTDTLAELYDQYRQYQDTISDFGGTLLDSLETIQKEREDELKKMSTLISAVGDNMKDLLDQVKRNLEERRKQEDNRKTESDISKKQQRLAALQADTSGGHQVEIAQLQKEIGDAQQNYQRTLEDQLLDRLQTQNDEAIKQRERMISLSEAQLAIATQNNTELVNLWLKDPEAYKSKIYDAYLEAINISEKLDIDQQLAKQDFNSKFASVVTAVDQIEIPNNLNALTQINSSITNLQGILTQQNTSKTSAQAQVTAKNTTSTATKPAASTTTPKVATPAAPKAAAKTTTTTTAKTTANKDADIWTKVKNTFKNLSIDAASGKQAALGADALRVAKIHKGEKVYIGNQDAHVGASGEIYWDRKGEVRKWNPSTGEIKKFKYDKNTYIKEANPKQSPYVYEEFRESLHTHGVKGYKTGGLASETGPAYLHGTPSKPELVLNAQDTKNFIALKDVLSKAVHSSNFASTSYGDATYEININVDKISSDYDVDKMAERVKKIIVSDSSYRNVTQVRKFR